MTVLTRSGVRLLASRFTDWDVEWVVWQVFDAGTGNGESSGKTDAYNAAGPYRGLLQVWDENAIRFGYRPEEMFEPAKNLDVSHSLWLERGTKPWPSAVKYTGRQAMTGFPPDETAPVTSWLKGPRPAGCTPRLIIVHATRGANSQAAQYSATKSWFNSTGNGSAAQGWGGCATIVISYEGQVCRFMDELREVPRFSAGYGSFIEPNGWCADYWGLSMELAQSAQLEDFDPRTIERAALETAAWCKRYGIEPVHLGPTLQRGSSPARSGIVGHDELENGTKLGKTDPGSKFPWLQFMTRVGFYMGSTPAPIEEEIMQVHNSIATKFQGATGGAVIAADSFDAPPPPAKMLRVELYLTDTSPPGSWDGAIQVFHADGRYAGQVGWDGARYGCVDVVLPMSLKGDGVVSQIGVIGYWG